MYGQYCIIRYVCTRMRYQKATVVAFNIEADYLYCTVLIRINVKSLDK